MEAVLPAPVAAAIRDRMAGAFAYSAIGRDGSAERGVLHAADITSATALLAGRGLFPTDIRPAEASPLRVRRRLSAADTASGLRTLSTLLEAGLPVGRALWAFADVAPAAWVPSVPMLQQAVREGHGLSGALAMAPLGLPPVVPGLLRAGEASGNIARSVSRAAELAERDAALRSSIRSALAYPLLLAVVGTGAVVLLVTVVIPRFAEVLLELGLVLPPVTRLVLTAAGIAQTAAVPAALVAGVAGLAWLAWVRSEAGRVQWHTLLLTVPLLGAVRMSGSGARACTAAGELLESGMPLSGALLHAASASGDMEITRRVLEARAQVIRGTRLSAALARQKALSQVAVKLIQTGEETGKLAPMFTQAARVESARAEQITRAAVRLLEPTLLLVFGGIVALVAAALLQAVYGVRPTG